VLDAHTGHLRWDLSGLAGTILTVGGAGSICVLTDAGADCRAALDGTALWSTTWPGSGASATYPALELHRSERWLAALRRECERPHVRGGGDDIGPRLSTWARATHSWGSFVLTALNMATGKTAVTIPLPAFDNSESDHAVSLALPPGILAVGDGTVLVSPQFDETDVVQAFATQASG